MKIHSHLLFAAFFALAVVSAARAETFETIVNNGSAQNRVDIAVLGDGYTASQMAQYRADVQTAMQRFFQQEPFLEYQKYFNVHRVEVISNQSGADHSNRQPPVFADTALDAAYNCSNIQRLVCVNLSKVNTILARSVPPSHAEIVLVVVNDTEYGGSGGNIAVFSIDSSAVEIALHEVGHSFGLLADEYAGGGPSCNPNFEPAQVNATRETSREAIKWRHWIAPTTLVPTLSTVSAVPGLFAGSRYCETELFRPTYNNKMRSLGVPFEQINNEQLVKRIYNFISPIDAFSPANTNVILSDIVVSFSVTPTQPRTHGLTVNWFVDGQAANSGAQLQIPNGLSAGNHTFQAVVSDTTPFVRSDPNSLLIETKTWNVSVQPDRVGTPIFDFDGDLKTDVSVYRGGTWFIQQSRNGFAGIGFGLDTDKPAPADYDGDGRTDIAVYRGGSWYVLGSRDGFSIVSFGSASDVPVPADYDGDGKADQAVFRSSNGVWYLLQSRAGFRAVQFGASGDIPQIGDFDADFKADFVVYRPSNGVWHQIGSRSNQYSAAAFGATGDIPASIDFDGDLRKDYAVFRPSNGVWYLLRSTQGFTAVQFGGDGDVPVVGDYDGDDKGDIAVFRPSNGVWYRLNSRDNSFFAAQFGASGDIAVPAAFLPREVNQENE